MGIITALIGTIVFITGKNSLPHLLEDLRFRKEPPIEVRYDGMYSATEAAPNNLFTHYMFFPDGNFGVVFSGAIVRPTSAREVILRSENRGRYRTDRNKIHMENDGEAKVGYMPNDKKMIIDGVSHDFWPH